MAEPPKKIAVLEKSLQILEYMINYPYGISLSELEAGVHLNKSTIYRILYTLKEHGYIRQNPGNSKYYLGFEFLAFSSVFEDTDISRIAAPHLQRLAEATKDLCHLVIRDNTEGVYISKVEPSDNGGIRVRSRIGARIPLHCTSVGKVLLANLPDAEVEEILEITGLPARTIHTITNPLALKKELEKVRQQGYAIDDLENEENIRCVAAPVRDHTGKVVASVSSTGTVLSMTEETLPQVIREVCACAELISQELGLQPSPRKTHR